ncbi:MAG: tRNA (N6-isopentenyl adenosine(37)-C2)-methylthiotransferase MiaB [Oscillospiraceae bacterium]|nr:tRNA (N6-isopentenyl adenosine(37)-C2)-methylthiotransferase MiaB [Oscillospiraceae bacterium]
MQIREGIRAVLETFPHTPRAHVQSFGCQLNFCDGEKYKGILQDLGYELTDQPEEADVILFNACAVRAHAESRVIGRLGALKPIRERNPRLVVGLCGCMAEEDEVRALLKKSYPFVKIVLGAGAMERLPESLLAVYSGEKHSEALQFAGLPDETLPTVRTSGFQASVPVMYGCNNFCTYCIVPYVRGRERSRTPEAIEREVRGLIGQGYREILLLGQNVNSYGRGLSEPIDFPALLRRLDAIPGDYFIRFMSSHPKDATPELIDTMLQSEHIEYHLHLPVQCGSNRVLSEMNRRYTVEKYLELIDYTRSIAPDFGFSSDLIVGFPTETAEDFEGTMRIVEYVKYDNLYTFIYSPRSGTKAAQMPFVSSQEEISARMRRLLARQREISEEFNGRFLGKRVRFLAEKRDPETGLLLGKTREGLVLEAPGDDADIGRLLYVTVTGVKNWALTGTRIRGDAAGNESS